jgi:hypothetical protein
MPVNANAEGLIFLSHPSRSRFCLGFYKSIIFQKYVTLAYCPMVQVDHKGMTIFAIINLFIAVGVLRPQPPYDV